MANTLFIFLNEPNAFDQALSVIMDEQGNEVAPCKIRTSEELQTIHKNTPLSVVLPCNRVLCQQVTLPTLKNAVLMLPNIIEESLITPIEQTHFVLDPSPIADKQYLAYYIDKAFLTELLETLTTAGLSPSKITSDLLASHQNVCLIGPDFTQFIYRPLLMGALNEAGLQSIETTQIRELEKITFENTNIHLNKLIETKHSTNKLPTSYQAYVAAHLAKFGSINLLDGEFEIKKKRSKSQYLLTMPLVVCAFIFLLFTNIVHYRTLNQSVEKLKQDNFSYYQRVFPEAKQMISPRFRIEQWLKSQQSNQQTPVLSILQLASPILSQNSELKILSMQAQHEQLTLTFQLENFDDLEQMKIKLEQTGVNVEQLNANTENHIINAIWKLTL